MNEYFITYEDCSQNDSCMAKDGEVYLEIYNKEHTQVYEAHLK